MQDEVSNRTRKGPVFWCIMAVIVPLNLWFDYYHPLGFLFDVIILVVLVVKFL